MVHVAGVRMCVCVCMSCHRLRPACFILGDLGAAMNTRACAARFRIHTQLCTQRIPFSQALHFHRVGAQRRCRMRHQNALYHTAHPQANILHASPRPFRFHFAFQPQNPMMCGVWLDGRGSAARETKTNKYKMLYAVRETRLRVHQTGFRGNI